MIYAELDADKNLIQAIALDDGPVYFEHREGCTYRALEVEPDWNHPTPTSVLRWEDDWPEPQWVETATLDDLKAAKLAELAQAFSKGMEAVKAGYPEEEVLSWSKQEAEATAYAASPSAPVPLLSGIASARGIEVDDLAGRVLAKARAWAIMSGAMIGRRQACEDAVDAATTIEEVRAIVWQ